MNQFAQRGGTRPIAGAADTIRESLASTSPSRLLRMTRRLLDDGTSAQKAAEIHPFNKPPVAQKLAMRIRRVSALAGSLAAVSLWPSPSLAGSENSIQFLYTLQQNAGEALDPPAGQDWWLKGVATDKGSGIEFIFTTAASGHTGQFFNDFVFNVADGPTSVTIACTGNANANCQSTTGNSGDGDYVQNGSAPLGNFIATTGWELTLLNAPPQGGDGNKLNEVAVGESGETIMFHVTGLTVAQLTTNPANGFFSCTHHQGLAGPEGSSRLCATLSGRAPSEVPGPLPLLGAAAAFGYSRKLRHRLNVRARID